MSAQQVMRVAQGLYERGYITYMRTDSTTLSATALSAARQQIQQLFGRDYLPDAPRTYASKSKNAQEAHEAIRPAGDTFRTPDQLRGELSNDDLRLYELIWQRTMASQMPDARGSTVTARIVATTNADELTEWSASGRTITFPGYLAVYGFGGEDDSVAEGDTAAKLPDLAEGLQLPAPAIEAQGHSTQPPARYTEATLVRALEEKGIGRPSTYASIMTTIQDRGYVWKRGQALVPTPDAFAVVNLLEQHFTDLVDYDFTAHMEDDLDEIAAGHEQREPWLGKFWFGNGTPGVKALCAQALEQADPAEINAIPIGVDEDGEPIVVRNGKYGPYVKRGDDTASLPDDLALDELTIDRAVELLNAPKGDEPIGTDPATGLPVYAKNGRFGPYVQLGDADTLPDKQKPKMESLLSTMSLTDITLDDALKLLSLPRVVGVDDDGVEVTAQNGRYGPYIKKGEETRSLESEEQIFTVTLERGPRAAGPAQAVRPPPRQAGGAAARARQRSGVRPARRREGRTLRSVRHRRRGERVAAQGRRRRRHHDRAGRRAPADPPRDRAEEAEARRRRRRRRRPRRRRPPRRPRQEIPGQEEGRLTTGAHGSDGSVTLVHTSRSLT